ncbi:cupin domain-containing protein [Desulfitobacterium chlororespirans]|nr:cupin domain-containing protein [Desulfitobacterium chlororespirans]
MNNIDKIYAKLSEMEWTDVAVNGRRVGVKVKNFEAEKANLRLQEIEYTGKESKAHQHIHEQIVVTISGTMEMTIEDRIYYLESGDMIAIPPNAIHFTKVTDPQGVKNLLIFVPKQEGVF